MLSESKFFIADKLQHGERETAQSIADFDDLNLPMARTAILIPVTAHRDTQQIVQTMAEYNKQRGREPFKLFLYLNCPADEGYLAIVRAEAEVLIAQVLFPNLDIRSSYAHYADN